jgi:predicted membrane protein DUF2231
MFGIRTVLGLPVHVLLVHFAVVLVPLAALVLIGTCWRPRWRVTYSLPVAALAVGGAVAAFISAQSGGTLRRSIRETALTEGTRARFGSHPGYGNIAEVAAMFLALAAVAIWGTERWGARFQLKTWMAPVVYAASCGIALLAIVTMVLAGHSGSTLVWKDLGNYVTSR